MGIHGLGPAQPIQPHSDNNNATAEIQAILQQIEEWEQGGGIASISSCNAMLTRLQDDLHSNKFSFTGAQVSALKNLQSTLQAGVEVGNNTVVLNNENLFDNIASLQKSISNQF